MAAYCGLAATVGSTMSPASEKEAASSSSPSSRMSALPIRGEHRGHVICSPPIPAHLATITPAAALPPALSSRVARPSVRCRLVVGRRLPA